MRASRRSRCLATQRIPTRSTARFTLALVAALGAGPPLAWAGDGAAGAPSEKPVMHEGYRQIEWTQLMPEDDLDALLNPPEELDEIADGSAEDQLASQMKNAIELAADSRYQQALVSTRVIPAFDGQAIRLPGFVVPLAFNEKRAVTEFFLVPYFGACIHVPPPPPNQIVYAQYPAGFQLDNINQPYWVSGILKTSLTENDVATAAYAFKVEALELYTE